MAHPRCRNDSSSTMYQVTNRLIGEAGELLLDDRQMGKLSLIIRQANRLFCVNVVSFKVSSMGYSLTCSAPAEIPSLETLRAHFTKRYGKRREMPDFEDPAVYQRWARRLRDFSCLIKDIQQLFTQWYNRVVRKRKRKGTLWKSRFESRIMKTARRALTAVRAAFVNPTQGLRLRKVRGQQWRKSKNGYSFLRDTTLPVLAGAGTFALLTAYVLLDEFSHCPGIPFPVKMLRDIVRKGVWKHC